MSIPSTCLRSCPEFVMVQRCIKNGYPVCQDQRRTSECHEKKGIYRTRVYSTSRRHSSIDSQLYNQNIILCAHSRILQHISHCRSPYRGSTVARHIEAAPSLNKMAYIRRNIYDARQSASWQYQHRFPRLFDGMDCQPGALYTRWEGSRVIS